MKLANKVAIITGASQSIGKGIALRFAKEGAKVVVNYLSNGKLAEAVVDEIRQQGGEAFAFRANVAEEDDARQLVEATVARYGTVDILVNNAAIDPRQKWNEISVADWDRVMTNNVRSQFVCCKAVYPYMQKQRYGKIINVSSVTFWFGKTNYVHYVASKGAIIGFTRALAREIGGDNITINCITPGAVKTETELAKVGSVESLEEAESQLKSLQAIPRRQLIGDLDGAFVFLASSDSDFITGQTLNVDGGWMMH